MIFLLYLVRRRWKYNINYIDSVGIPISMAAEMRNQECVSYSYDLTDAEIGSLGPFEVEIGLLLASEVRSALR